MSKLIKKQSTYTVELTQSEVDLIRALLGRVSYKTYDRMGIGADELIDTLGGYTLNDPRLIVWNGVNVVMGLDVRPPRE